MDSEPAKGLPTVFPYIALTFASQNLESVTLLKGSKKSRPFTVDPKSN
jgi:hypothetical protein